MYVHVYIIFLALMKIRIFCFAILYAVFSASQEINRLNLSSTLDTFYCKLACMLQELLLHLPEHSTKYEYNETSQFYQLQLLSPLFLFTSRTWEWWQRWRRWWRRRRWWWRRWRLVHHTDLKTIGLDRVSF